MGHRLGKDVSVAGPELVLDRHLLVEPRLDVLPCHREGRCRVDLGVGFLGFLALLVPLRAVHVPSHGRAPTQECCCHAGKENPIPQPHFFALLSRREARPTYRTDSLARVFHAISKRSTLTYRRDMRLLVISMDEGGQHTLPDPGGIELGTLGQLVGSERKLRQSRRGGESCSQVGRPQRPVLPGAVSSSQRSWPMRG